MKTSLAHSRAARRAAAASVGRTVVISAAVIAGSTITGDVQILGAGLGPFIAFFLALWTAIVIAYLTWQIRAIRKAPFPEIRAMETLITGGVILLALFAKAYLLISVADPSAFSEPLTSFSTYYFTVTVLGTVGFGDITPVSVLARSVAMVQIIFDLALLAVFVRLVVGAVKRGRSHQLDTDGALASPHGGGSDIPGRS